MWHNQNIYIYKHFWGRVLVVSENTIFIYVRLYNLLIYLFSIDTLVTCSPQFLLGTRYSGELLFLIQGLFSLNN